MTGFTFLLQQDRREGSNLRVDLGKEAGHLSTGKARPNRVPEHLCEQARAAAIRPSAAARDVCPVRLHCAQAVSERAIAHEIEEQIVALGRTREIFARVVDHLIRPIDRTSSTFVVLHTPVTCARAIWQSARQRSPRRPLPVDENGLSRLNFGLVAYACSAVIPAMAGMRLVQMRFPEASRQVGIVSASELRKCTFRYAKQHARLERCNLGANCFHNSGNIAPSRGNLGLRIPSSGG